MPALALYQPGTAPKAPKQPAASIASDTGVKLVLPFAPREVSLGGWAHAWEPLERPGRRPIVRRTAAGLPTESFTVVLARPDHQTSIEDLIGTLRKLAEDEGRMWLGGLSTQERGPWRLTDVSVDVTNRQAGTNAITRATASLSFVAAYDAAPRIGALSGGSSKGAPAGANKVRHYVIRKGDTLRKISAKMYGTPDLWRIIAKANKITQPNRLKVGRRLTIPAHHTAKKKHAAKKKHTKK